MKTFVKCLFVSLILGFCGLAFAEDAQKATVEINGKNVLPSNGTVAGVWFFHDAELGDKSPQLLITGFPKPTPKYRITAVLNLGDKIRICPPNENPLEFQAEKESVTIHTVSTLNLDPIRRTWTLGTTDCSPNFKPEIETALVEHDWRLQDGIDTPSEARTYQQAIAKMIPQIESLIQDLSESGTALDSVKTKWETLKTQAVYDEAQWLAVHQLRRELVLTNPLFQTGPILFAKNVPSMFSHQLTQVYGYTSRPGGGLFVLDQPGKSMQVRSLLNKQLPTGCYMHPEVGYDAKKIYFAYCEVNESPKVWRDPDAMNRRFHLYEVNVDGTGLRKLTDGEFDDFSPTCLPDGQLVFISTRRGGFHRCGGGPCFVYTLASMNPNSGETNATAKPISFHETNEWDPAVLNDGRIVYTRWDYVDRDAVFYQQLWSARQDGTNVRIYYGNNTFVPCGIWEAKPIPGTHKIMATAAPHHGMSAGSVVMLDTTLGVDGSEPITRLTPDARFPEAEAVLAYGIALPNSTDFDSPVTNYWDALNRPDRPGHRELIPTEQERRWGGHCYKSPFPLSEKYFIASYSYDRLRGEPGPNIPNMFGIYFLDVFGNKELIYRDPNISSVWATPLAPRLVPPILTGGIENTVAKTGTFYLQNVYESWPKLPAGEKNKIKALRIVQVLPKTTPNANSPMVGAAFASPGKQVLGTVPVEEDGSAYFECPSNIPVLFQALDAEGRAVQMMRSIAYLQPGEKMSCVGCHENRMQTLASNYNAQAMRRAPSKIAPGPDGSKPMSYPILVQPVLDKHCTSCHTELNREKNGGILLTGEPDGTYTKSYNSLISKVAYTAWGMANGNYEPLTEPNRFGARASALVRLLDEGHYDVKLSKDDWERINTWIDSNALFYGTFKPEDQSRQQRGERIAGPALE